MQQPSSLYKRHRFPGELISHAVWLYYRFLLSYRDVEELLAERGIAVSDETVRRWCRKFGQTLADGVRRRRSRPGEKWHVDEVQLKINGRKHWLWRARFVRKNRTSASRRTLDNERRSRNGYVRSGYLDSVRTMQAAFNAGPGQFELREVPVGAIYSVPDVRGRSQSDCAAGFERCSKRRLPRENNPRR